MNKRMLKILLVLLCAVFCVAIGVVVAIATTGAGTTGAPDATTEIEAQLGAYKVGSTIEIEDDGTIGIPVDISFYVDKAVNPSVKTGTDGTPVIMYIVNTNTVRTGTDSDVSIIRSMLDRGYVVAVYDFHNSVLATSLALENSLQLLRKDILNGFYVKTLGSPFPTSGTYFHHYIVPAGYNVSLDHVFWEMDKHGADGTLEKLVHVWNTDLRNSKAERLVKWVHDDGTRKKTDKGINDGSDPVWYTSSGVESATGEYTKLKYAVAETITDLVNPDGTPIDLGQHMNFIYPTNPANPVPIIVAAGSAGHIAENSQKEGRPHQQVFTFNGYALAVYDHLNVPMTREDSWGYFDGKLSVGGVTQDPISYSVDIYNDKKTNTAAMRYVRYMALLEEGDPDWMFDLDIDLNAIGVMGVSKSGTMGFLGEEIVQSPLVDKSKYSTIDEYEEAISDAINAFPSMKVFAGHHSESYYDNGKTQGYEKDGYVIDGGERQPWLTYKGEEIISGAQLIYCSCGNNPEDIHEGHAPVVVSRCLLDGGDGHAAHYFDNICRTMGIPSITLEYDLGHTMMYGNDSNYDTDGIIAFLNFADYYLKGSAIKVVYISPLNKEADVETTSKITVQFSGTATADKLALVTVKDAAGNVVSGTWTPDYGGTQWHFAPANALLGNTKYTVTVPATFSGDNNVEMGADASVSFTTREAVAGSATVSNNFVSATVPNLTADTNSFVLRFYVSEEKAANIAKVYAVSSTTDTAGTLLGSVNLRGAGFYELDVTAYAAEHQGETVYFRIDEGKTPVVNNPTYKQEFNGYGTYGDCKSTVFSRFDGTKQNVLAVYSYAKSYYASSNQTVENGYNSFNTTDTAIWYEELSEAFTNDKLFKSSKLTEEDYGRRFTVSIDVYDDISRKIQFKLSSCTNQSLDVIDYDVYISNHYTKAGEWTTFTFEYQVYESKYGVAGNIQKALTALIGTDGDAETRVLFDNLTVTETVTDVTVTSAAVVAVNNGGVEYKSPTNTAAPFTVGTSTYTTLKAALEAAAASNGVVTLNANYNMTSADTYSAYVSHSGVDFVIDLNGYYINTAEAAGSLITVVNSAAASSAVDITLKNGAVYLKDYALIQYTGSAAAGDGNVFNVNVENVNLSLIKYPDLDEIILQSTVSSGRRADVNVNLDEVNITALNAENGNHRTTVFAKSAQTTTSIVYTVKGGSIKLSDNRHILITNTDIQDLIFVKDASGERTELIVQNSKKAPATSFWSDDTYKSFMAKTVGETHTVYTLEDGELKTPYGMIPEEYANVDYYPWVVFDVNGVVTYAGTEYALDNLPSVLKTGQNNTSTWNVILRRDFHYNSASGYNNLSFINGTINIDLNGHTFYNDAPRAMFNAQGKSASTSTINVFNGDITVTTAQPVIHSSVIAITGFTSGLKTFNYSFDGVDFKFTNGAANLISSHGSCAAGVRVSTNITLNDCNIDASALSGKTVFSLGQTSGTAGAATLTVNGGSLKVSDAATKLYNLNNGVSSVTFGKSTSGEFFKMIQPSSLAAPSFSTPSEEFVLSFVEGVPDGSNMVYTLVPGGELTEYGPIGQAYIDAGQYPFAVFCDGELLGVASKFSAPGSGVIDGVPTALGLALAKSKALASNDAVITILVRRDYTMTGEAVLDNMAQMRGTFVIDIDEHTFTSSGYMFNGQAKSDNVTGNVVIKDGGLAVTSQALIKATAYGTSYPGGKTYNYDFENVTFSFASGATTKNILANYVNDTSTDKNTYLNLDLKDCEFDLANAPDGVTVLNANDTSGEIIANIKTENCRILSDSADGFTYASANAANGSSVSFGEGKSALALVLPAEAAAPTAKVTNGGKEFSLIRVGTEGEKAVYQLLSMVTPYGTIPDEYSSVTEHPFLIFYNGEVIASSTVFSHWDDKEAAATCIALKKLVALNDKNAVVTVLVRTDYNNADAVVNNWAGIVGTLVIDLGNNTINTTNYLLNAQAKGTSTDSNIVVKNGTVNVNRTGVLKAETYGTAYDGSKVYNYTFENVTFGFMSGATTKSLLVTYLSNDTTAKTAALNIALNNCTFDMTNAPSGIVLINANDSASSEIITTVTVTGGKIVSEMADSFVLSSIHASNGSKIDYFKGADDSYIKLLVADENSLPLATTVISTPEGTGSFLKMGKEDGMTLYKVAFSKKTEYGYIPAQYESVQDYPFVSFDGNGNFLGASKVLFDGNNDTAFHLAKNASTANGTVIVLLRRDYTVGNEVYDNLAQFKGTLIFDLGGFKLTTSSGEPLFRVTAKSSGGMFKTTVIIKNGTINLGKNSIMGVKSFIGSYTGTDMKEFDFLYQNVTIGLAPGSTTGTLLLTQLYQNDMTSKFNITLDNCTLDLKTVAPTGNITLIDANDPKGFNVVNVTVKGGKLLIADTSKVTLQKVHETNGSSVVWDADSKGVEITVSVPSGMAFSASLKNSNGDKIVAKFIGTADGYDNYKLTLKELEISGLLYNLSLANDMSINLAIPAAAWAELKSVTVGGVALEGTLTRIDGADYYLVNFDGVDAVSTTEVVEFVLTGKNTGENPLTVSLSVASYAEQLLKNGENEIEKELARAILEYTLAAHNLLAAEDVEAIAALTALLEGTTAPEAKTEFAGAVNTMANVPVLTGASLRLNATPAFTIYLAEGVTEDTVVTVSYESRNDGLVTKTVTLNAENRSAVLMGMKVYDLDNTLTVKVGDQVGTYNLAAYLNGLCDLADSGTAEDALNEAFANALYNYVVAAEAFQNK